MEDERRVALGSEIRARRVALGWSQDELAERAHMKVETVARLENGSSHFRPATLRRICDELELDPSSLLGAKAASVDVDSDTVARLVDQVTRLISKGAAESHLIEPQTYLTLLARELAILRGEKGDSAAIALLVDEIKRFCVTSELYFTSRVGASSGGGTFLYSCSSLIDHGVGNYLADSGWMLLLRAIGQTKRQFAGDFMRVFFVEKNLSMAASTLTALAEVVRLHLRAGVAVALVDQGNLDVDAVAKRNMAWIGGEVLLHATDQRRWDLEFSTDGNLIRRAREQHEYFRERAIVLFLPGQEKSILRQLTAVFKTV